MCDGVGLDVLPLLPKAAVATAAFAGLREGEGESVDLEDGCKPSKDACEPPAGSGDPALSRALDEYRASMQNPSTGVVFHDGSGRRMDMDKLAQLVIRSGVEAIGLPWYGWHGFRRGIASNPYAVGASEKVVQRILRHAKPHVAKQRYIKAFDPDVLEAMQRMQMAVGSLQRQRPAVGQQQN